GDGDVRNVHAQNFHEFLFHADAVHIRNFVPYLERDDEVQALFVANAFDAEHRGDVDDADAANFHVLARQFSASADDFAAVHQSDPCHVIGDQAVAALDERQHRLAFADAAFTANQHAHAEDVHHAAHLRTAWRKHGFERERRGIDEFHRDRRALKNRHARGLGAGHKFLVRAETAAENNARNFEGEKVGVTFRSFGGRERPQIIHLRVAENLHAFVGEVMRESAQHEAGTVYRRFADDALQTTFPAQQPHLQRGGVFLVELFNGDDLALHIHKLNSGPR